MIDAAIATTRAFLERYYAEKKRKYLQNPKSAAAMITGTPHDWEDAQRYEASPTSSQ